MRALLLVLLVAACLGAAAAAPLPVVLWHGMGDTCCNPISMGSIALLLQQNIPGVYVYSLEIGSTIVEDERNGFLMNVNDQIEYAHNVLAADPKLAGGFNAVGFSQGGQFLRAYVERYNDPPVHNLISVGGQHQGVFGFPRCPGNNSELCDEVRKLLNLGVYVPIVQDHLVQAEYWQDPLNEAEYLNKSVFLADINNARPQKNATYRANMLTLNAFVMVLFLNDSMVQPRESEWFGWYAPGQDRDTVPLQQTPIYTEDWIGLQTLDQQHKLHFISTIGDHLQFTSIWFIDNIIGPFLNASAPASLL